MHELTNDIHETAKKIAQFVTEVSDFEKAVNRQNSNFKFETGEFNATPKELGQGRQAAKILRDCFLNRFLTTDERR